MDAAAAGSQSNKFSFAGGRSRNNSIAVQSSYEYYEEVEEIEVDVHDNLSAAAGNPGKVIVED